MKRLLLATLAVVSLLCAFAPSAHAGAYVYDAGTVIANGGVIIMPPTADTGIIVTGPKEGGVIQQVKALDPEADPGDAISSVLNAAKGGQWRLLAGLLLSLLVWAARRWGSTAVPWLKTDRGGAALVLLLALLGGVATTLAGDAPFAWSLLANSVSLAFTGAGGYAVVRKLLAPSDGVAS